MIVSAVLVAIVVLFVASWLVDRRRRRKLVALAEQGRLTNAQTDGLVGPATIDSQLAEAVAEIETLGHGGTPI